MPIHDPRDPMSQCPHCGRAGLVGSEREVTGDKAVTVFKCHHCEHTWRVPDWPANDRDQRREG
jgi:DNA-directed RNA polymerase subunit M/transcription elongation factor TFIIS